MSKRGIKFGKETKVQQQFKEDTKISVMMSRFRNTGTLPQGNAKEPLYLDHTKIGDYTEMLNTVTRTQQQFMNMPARIRARFHNKPQELLDFLGNEDNRKEAQELGLIPPSEDETQKPVKKPAPQKPSPEDPQIELERTIEIATEKLKKLKEKGENPA